MNNLCVILAFTIGLANINRLTMLCAGIKDYRFLEEQAATLSDIPFRFSDRGWSHVTWAMTCARRVAALGPEVRGYVFDRGFGVCTPLLWLREGSGSPSFKVPAGDLYLRSNYVCPLNFQVIKYGPDQRQACIHKINTVMTYDVATSHCASMGGYLASVKSSEKLSVAAEFYEGESAWIGLDDQLVEGTYLWQEDNSTLTRDQQESVFSSGEPNAIVPSEDCVEFQWGTQALNDARCWHHKPALCEVTP